MATYIVWNKENTGCDTYEELLQLERDGYSHSSGVSTDDIAGVINAVLNETNADFGYHLVKTLPTPIVNLTGPCHQIQCNSCIITDKVYKAVPPLHHNSCDGCLFNTGLGNLPEYCGKMACTRVSRKDNREVIWVEHTDHYTGHEV